MARSVIGKTIARVEERPTSPKRGYESALLIHFTDGTAMIIVGSSWEEVDLDWQAVDRDEVGWWARAAQGRRELERLARLRREEEAALSDEARDARRQVRRAKMSPLERAMEDELLRSSWIMRRDLNHATFGEH